MAAGDIPLCPNDPGIWQHISGWEVVAAVSVVALGWSAVSIARFYYMAEIANGKRRPLRKLRKPPAKPNDPPAE